MKPYLLFAVTIVGYIGHDLETHPLFEMTEGEEMKICVGITDGDFNPKGFFEISMSLAPDDESEGTYISISITLTTIAACKYWKVRQAHYDRPGHHVTKVQGSTTSLRMLFAGYRLSTSQFTVLGIQIATLPPF